MTLEIRSNGELLLFTTLTVNAFSAMASNSTKTNKPFPPGIHGPSITFFQNDQQQEIDWATQERHLEYMITSGMHGGMSCWNRFTE